ncbi:MAG: hypothetical protein HY851_01545 [candidate division Zixibacteria bacterium]|nr:hypothetical protein [candidate division Zixibacteria bacterium]
MLSRRGRILLLVVVTICAGFIVLVRFTSVARLEAVTLNGVAVSNPWTDLGFKPGLDIVQQPLEELTDSLIAVDTIFKVSALRQWPHEVKISINEFETCAWLVDSLAGDFYGVDPLGRILPAARTAATADLPVLTGITTRGMYRLAADPRLSIVLPRIVKVRAGNPLIFPLLSEIDFSNTDYLTLSFSGMPYRVRVSADLFEEHFNNFVRFTSGFDANLATSILLDMRYPSMIVSTDTLTPDTTQTEEEEEE